MNKLEKYIKDNNQSFQVEPHEGHFDRFKAKMDNQAFSGRKIRLFPQILKVASVVILIVISSLWTYEKLSNNNISEGISLSDVSPEYMEVEQFYAQKVSMTYTQMDRTNLFSDEEQKKIVMHELTEMDSIYKNLKKDLETNPDDERIINAMIEHYQLKLEIMSNILGQLQEINDNYKQTDHENNEI